MAKRCPTCFNTYPSWSPATCPVCARNERDAKRYGRPYASASEKYGRIAASTGVSAGTSGSKPKRDARQDEAAPKRTDRTLPNSKGSTRELVNTRVSAMNSLLEDVYSRPYRLSQILIRRGVSPSQTDEWGSDVEWLAKYLEELVDGLCDLVAAELPESDPLVILRSYGLDDGRPSDIEAVSRDLGVSESNVKSHRNEILELLCTDEGKTKLEDLVLKAARS